MLVMGPFIVVNPETLEENVPFTFTVILNITFVALKILRFITGVINPIRGRVIFPVPAAKSKEKAPLIFCKNVIFPDPNPVLKKTSFVNIKGEAKVIESFVVVMEPPNWTLPNPV